MIIDSLRPDHVGCYGSPQIQTPNIDALAARGIHFTRAFPEAMVTVPARRSIFGSRRIFPFRNWKPNPVIGTSPGWLPIDDPQKTFTTVLKDNGYWTAQVSDNPFTAFMGPFEPFRKTFHRWETIVGQSGFRQDPRNVPISTVDHWLPPFLRDERYIPGMRKYLANTGEGTRRGGDLRRARLQGRSRPARRRAPPRSRSRSSWTASTRTSRGARRRSTSTCTATPATTGQEVGVTPYGFARNFTPELLRRAHAAYAGEVTMMDHWFGHFMDRFHELGLQKNTVIVLLSDHGYLLGERGFTGKVPSQLHPELAQVPFVDRAPGRPRRRHGEPALRLHPRRGADGAVDGGHRPARAG